MGLPEQIIYCNPLAKLRLTDKIWQSNFLNWGKGIALSLSSQVSCHGDQLLINFSTQTFVLPHLSVWHRARQILWATSHIFSYNPPCKAQSFILTNKPCPTCTLVVLLRLPTTSISQTRQVGILSADSSDIWNSDSDFKRLNAPHDILRLLISSRSFPLSNLTLMSQTQRWC